VLPIADASGGSTSLGGTQVSVNNEFVPVVYSSVTQVKFLCPNLQPGIQLAITVKTPSASSSVLSTTTLEAAPGSLSMNDGGGGQGIVSSPATTNLAMNRNFRVPGNPAQPGDQIQIWATGLGFAANLTPGAVIAKISGIDVAVQSVQAVPGYAGVYTIQTSGPAGGTINDAVPVQLEVVTPDGRHFDSNTVSMPVEAVRQ
jgi:uncharacterized protein (TIGR03437 family)